MSDTNRTAELILKKLEDLEAKVYKNYTSDISRIKKMKDEMRATYFQREVRSRKIANITSGQFYCGRCGILMSVSDRLPYTMDVPDDIKHTIHRIKICDACYHELVEELKERNKNE